MALKEEHMHEVQHIKTACRNCNKTIFEDDHHCKYCNTGAPGINSHCPICKSKNYVYHKYGYNWWLGILAIFALIPLSTFFEFAPFLGLILGLYGKDRTECICLDCKQGWFPFDTAKLTRFNSFVEDEKATRTRKFKKIPNNCYAPGDTPNTSDKNIIHNNLTTFGNLKDIEEFESFEKENSKKE